MTQATTAPIADKTAADTARTVRIDSVYVRHLHDADADTSYLEQEGFEERLRQYQAEGFHYLGIRAEAIVSYPAGNGCRRCEKLTSSGLWGIESDSSEEYIRGVENEEINELAAHLAHFGIQADAEWMKEIAVRGEAK